MPAKRELFTVSGITAYVLCFFLFLLFQLGYLKNCFQTLDGEEPQFSSYGQASRKLLRYLAACFLYTIITATGFALLVIPGIYLTLRLQFFFAAMVDEDMGIIKSFRRSWSITRGQSLRLFAVMLMMIGIAFVGQIALFVGIFVAIPLTVLMYCATFRRLTAPAAQ
jgi:uncharacterized membrane protein